MNLACSPICCPYSSLSLVPIPIPIPIPTLILIPVFILLLPLSLLLALKYGQADDAKHAHGTGHVAAAAHEGHVSGISHHV